MGKFNNKVIFITGAASGMGKAQAILFAKEGAKVVVTDIDTNGATQVANEIHSQDGEAIAALVDVTNLESIKNGVKSALDKYGKIDILCNTAGVLDAYKPSLETSEELWDRILDVNLKGMYRVTNQVLPQMIDRGKGVIINVASIASFVAGGGGAAYTSSKHAIVGYTKQLSYDYGHKGIRVNAIAPGAVETSMTKEILSDPTAPVMELVNSVPAGRHGQPEEIAHLSLFLASDEADFIHGAIIPIDGGWLVK